MAKAKRVGIYNKGRRTWPLVDGEEQVSLNPGKSLELDEVLVDKMIKNYPNDFIKGGKPEAEVSAEIKKHTKKIEALEKENAELKEEIETLKAAAEEVVVKEAE